MKKGPIISALRNLWLKSPERNQVKKNARVERGKYQCSHCNQLFTTKEIQIHHVNPVIPEHGFTTWDDYIQRLFCGIDGLMAVCKVCHNEIHGKK